MRGEVPKPRILTPDLDNIWVEATDLKECQKIEMNGATLFRGLHSDYGRVDIVITDFGDARILCQAD